MSGLIEYLQNSFLLIYWSCFKVFSIEARLTIHLEKEENRKYLFKKIAFLLAQITISSLLITFFLIIIFHGFYLGLSSELFSWKNAFIGIVNGIAISIFLALIVGFMWNSTKVRNTMSSIGASLAFGTVGNITFCTLFGVMFGMIKIIPRSIILGLAGGTVCGIAGSILSGLARRNNDNISFNDLLFGMSEGTLFAFLGWSFDIAGTSISSLISGVIVGIIAGALGGIRFYFWLPEFFWTVYLWIRQIITKSPPPLKYLPTQLDELIILPLPFLEDFIVENYAKSSVATLQKIGYLTNFTNQQKLAANSRISIVVNCLDHCKSITEIIAIPSEFHWLPSPLPDDYKFDTSITQLIEIAKDMQSVATASSPYRAIELLKHPSDRLQAIQQNLAFSKSRHRPTLGQITQRWLAILKTAKENYETQAANSFEIPPAYIAGNGLEPSASGDRFKGRADIFRAIEEISLSDSPPVLLLYGGRRTGKTSSLKYLPNKVDSGLVPLLVDLQGTALSNKLSSFAAALAQQIIDFAKDRHNLRIDPPNAAQLEDDPFPTLQNWFSDIEKLKPHARFLLCLDEYERLSEVIDATGSKAPLNFLRSTMQNNKRWILLFSGSHTPDELEPYWNDTLINAQSIRMSYLNRPEAEDLICHPVHDFPDIYTDAAVERLIHWTNCQPYLIQMMGTVLVDTINLEQAEPRNYRITAADIDRLIPKALERASQYFSELWRNTLTAPQRENLTQFMLDGHLDGIPQNQIRSLIEKEILYKKMRAIPSKSPSPKNIYAPKLSRFLTHRNLLR